MKIIKLSENNLASLVSATTLSQNSLSFNKPSNKRKKKPSIEDKITKKFSAEIEQAIKNLHQKGAAICIGNFDGMHIAHQALIKKNKEHASSYQAKLPSQKNTPNKTKITPLKSVVLTFAPHPVEYILQNRQDLYLQSNKNTTKATESINKFYFLDTLEEKINKIAKFKIDYLIILQFSQYIMQMSPQDFFHKILLNLLNAKSILTGYNFHFGKNKEGNVTTLSTMAKKNNIDFSYLKKIDYNDMEVSSTHLKQMLETGSINIVRKMLASENNSEFDLKSITIEGIVEKGAGLANSNLKTPTANITLSSNPDLQINSEHNINTHKQNAIQINGSIVNNIDTKSHNTPQKNQDADTCNATTLTPQLTPQKKITQRKYPASGVYLSQITILEQQYNNNIAQKHNYKTLKNQQKQKTELTQQQRQEQQQQEQQEQQWQEKKYFSISNLGYRPSLEKTTNIHYNKQNLVLETHILDSQFHNKHTDNSHHRLHTPNPHNPHNTYNNSNAIQKENSINNSRNLQLYGKKIRVKLIQFMRPERKFANMEMLKKQIILDKKNANFIIENFYQNKKKTFKCSKKDQKTSKIKY